MRGVRKRDIRTAELMKKIYNFLNEYHHVSIKVINKWFGVGVKTVHRIIH